MTTQYRYDDGIGAMPTAPASRSSTEAAARLRHTATIRIAGSSAHVSNPRLIVTRTHRPPVARGHRCFVLGKAVWK